MPMMTEGLTSLAASPGSLSTLNPGSWSWVPRVCPDATETRQTEPGHTHQTALTPCTLLHLSPGLAVGWDPQPTSCPQPGPAEDRGEELPRGCQRVFPGSHVVPRWALRFPAPQWEPAASPGPRHRQRSQPLAPIEERQELAANEFGAGRERGGLCQSQTQHGASGTSGRAGAPGVGAGGEGWGGH